ncbi:T-complex protein 1 subunit beta [Strongyloides ratti]|uniref:T-complex protein 1 subunit beta n=1 Tax=Strongyloides ratti TaxID=34506 RepID=A0A090L666_STRRB|nr:T-complex protein 1 subunit beta [Strongyloides ratti]CEF65291.1 T-complex protein 1 subunit beta [Strongyloides ratti]
MVVAMNVLKQTAEEERGENARMANFVGAIAIGDLVKSTLGPKGMDKILTSGQNIYQQITVTNDGATILKSIGVDNPAAKVLVNVSMTQDSEVGDGTTSVTVLAAELLKEAEKLIGQKIHPQTIINGFRKASIKAQKVLADSAIQTKDMREDLLKIARTTLGSKIVAQHKEFFSNLAVDVVMRMEGSSNLESIQYIKKLGGSMEDSYLDDGFLLEKTVGYNQPRRMENCNILLANTPMDNDKVKVFGTRVHVDSVAKVADLEKAEKEKMKDKVEKILKHGSGIMSIEHADFEGCERLALVLNCDIVSTFDTPENVRMGKCDLIEEVTIGEDTLLRFSGVPGKKACSVVLRGATKQILDEAERSLHDAFCVLTTHVKNSKTIAGAGASEVMMSNAILEEALKTAGKEGLAIEAFGRALLQLPTIICDNAGLDSADLVSQLRAAHATGKKNMGIDIENGRIADILELGVIESLSVKMNVVTAATEAAEQILRVDDILKCTPRPRAPDNRPC